MRVPWLPRWAACLLLVLVGGCWYLGRVHVWIEKTPGPTFDVEAFLRAHCFPRMRPLRGHGPDKTWFVARRAGRVVGCAALSDKGRYFLLHYDCVHPAHRGRGVGARLHRARLARCRARDARKPVRLYILEENRAAHALRRKFPVFKFVRRARLTDAQDPQATYLLYEAPGTG